MTDNLNDYIESGATEEINEVEKLPRKDLLIKAENGDQKALSTIKKYIAEDYVEELTDNQIINTDTTNHN